MKSRWRIILAAAVLVAGAFLITGPSASSQSTAVPAFVFLDVAQVFTKYDKAGDIQQQARLEVQKIDQMLEAKVQELKKLREELDLLVPGTPEFDQKKRQLDFEAFKLEYEEKELKQRVLGNAVQKMNLIYKEIQVEAENIARRRGIKAVFMYNEEAIEARSLDELRVLIASRPVLYRDKSLDITEEVLRVLSSK